MLCRTRLLSTSHFVEAIALCYGPALIDDPEKQNRTTAWPMIIKLRGGKVV